jgi:hypothetical protein
MLNPQLVDKAPWDFYEYHFFDAYFSAFFYYYSVTLLEIPLYFIYLFANQTFFSNTAVYLRFTNIKEYWNKRLSTIAIDAAIYIFIMYLLLFNNFIYFNHISTFFENWSFIFKSILSQWISFLVLGILFSFFSFLFIHPFIGMFITYIPVILDFVLTTTKIDMPPIFFIRTICLDPTYMEGYWYMILLMFGISAGLYLLSTPLFENRDFLTKEVVES